MIPKNLTTSFFCLCTLSAIATPVQANPMQKSTVLFNGKDLTGWTTVNPKFASSWSVVDGVITAGKLTNKVPANTYLATTREYADFEFSCLFRLQGDPKSGLINSGIQYRSTIKDNKIIGYQADIGDGYWGDIYDEHRRNRALVKGNLTTLSKILKPQGWNSYTIRCVGSHHTIYINGVKTADYIETDPNISKKGVIALQLHSGGAAKVEFQDLSITEL